MASIRDLTCIRSVSHMAEYGKYEEEFIVYGCSCMENGTIVYRISPQYREIAQFVEDSRRKRAYPSPVHSLMRRCVVQTGQREQLLYETELELAAVLQKTYPISFFEQLEQCGKAESSNAAKAIFDELRFQLNGIFSADYLQLFEGLVSAAWQAHLLTEASLVEIEQWLHKVKMQMAYDIVAKKPFVRTFYGICYVDAKGKYQYKVNAQEDIVLEEQRKIKRQNLNVSPIFHKTYWYDYGTEPKTIREQFKRELQEYYGDVYWQHWSMVRALGSGVSAERYTKALECMKLQGMKEAADAILEYGYDWNVFSCIDSQ